MHEMWTNRETLLSELTRSEVPSAGETTKETYVSLLRSSEAWWRLMRIFKVKQFQEGFKLACPPDFGEATGGVSRLPSLEATTPTAEFLELALDQALDVGMEVSDHLLVCCNFPLMADNYSQSLILFRMSLGPQGQHRTTIFQRPGGNVHTGRLKNFQQRQSRRMTPNTTATMAQRVTSIIHSIAQINVDVQLRKTTSLWG